MTDYPRPTDRLRWAASLIDRARADLATAASLIDGAACDCHGEDACRSAARSYLGSLAGLARETHSMASQHRTEDEEVFGE